MIKIEDRCENCKNATSIEQLCEVCIEHEDNYQKCPNCRGNGDDLVSVSYGVSCSVCEGYSAIQEHKMQKINKDYKETVLTGLYDYLNYHKIEILAETDGVYLWFLGEKIKMGKFK
jgi:primosomal protein N'